MKRLRFEDKPSEILIVFTIPRSHCVSVKILESVPNFGLPKYDFWYHEHEETLFVILISDDPVNFFQI